MKQLNSLISSGQLQQAMEHALLVLRDDPLNAQMRAVYVESPVSWKKPMRSWI